MKRTLRRWIVGLSMAVFAAVACLSQSRSDGNLLKNPGFEEGGDPPTAWSFEPDLASKGLVALARSHGGFALSLAPSAANTDTSKPLAVGQALEAQPYRGKALYFAGTLSASGAATAVVGVFAISGTGQMAAAATLARNAGAGGPERMEDLFRVPDTDEVRHLIFICAANGTSGAATFDDLVLSPDVPKRLGVAQADPGPPLAARIEVDAGRIVRAIPRTLYGINTEWVWNGNGIWDENRASLDPDLIRLTRELGVTLIRFPGGTFSDYYHWKDGLGPQASRPWQSGLPGESKSRHVLGTEEMLDFVRRSGSRLLLTANVGTGAASEAAEWVRYVNGRKDRADRVDWWEVGNEVYMDDGSKAAGTIAMTPQRYAERCLEFARAMRKVDPGIRIGAISNESYWANTHEDWDRTVLGKVGGEIDFVAVHNAYAPMVVSDTGRSLRDVYRAMLAAPVLVRKSLADLSASIRALRPADARRLTIAVTEWGTLYHALPSSRFVDHCKTLGSALYTAGVMMAFLDNPKVEAANYFKLVDQLFIGAIGMRGDRFAPTASYYALQLFARHFGSRLVRTRTVSPTFDSPAVGWVAAVKGAPYVESVSSLSKDGRTLSVMVVNKHFDRSVRCSMRLKGFRPGGQGVVRTLSGTGIDAHTGTAPKQIPGIDWAKQAEDEINPRFSRGGPGEVTLVARPLTGASETMTHTIPPHSVVCFEFRGAPPRATRP